MYSNNATTGFTKFKQDALAEWTLSNAAEQTGDEAPTLGYLQCFCDKRKRLGDAPDKEYHATNSRGEEETVQICSEFQSSFIWAKALDRLIQFIIVGANIVLRYVSIYIIDLIGCQTES